MAAEILFVLEKVIRLCFDSPLQKLLGRTTASILVFVSPSAVEGSFFFKNPSTALGRTKPVTIQILLFMRTLAPIVAEILFVLEKALRLRSG
jgi:hypothetical protein